jgi:hypothetical protein
LNYKKNIIFEQGIYNVPGIFDNETQTGTFCSDMSIYTNNADKQFTFAK